jgi:hypothetical protein
MNQLLTILDKVRTHLLQAALSQDRYTGQVVDEERKVGRTPKRRLSS